MAKLRRLRHALLFALGIVVTFTALGLGLAVLIGASGLSRFASNPWVNIGIGLVFVADGPTLAVPFAAVFVVGLVATGTGVMHDANHGAFGRPRWLNTTLAFTADVQDCIRRRVAI